MSQSLEDFLIEASQEEERSEILVRNKPFTVRPFTNAELKSMSKAAYIMRSGKREFDNLKYIQTVVITCCIEPDFKSKSWIDRAGVNTPEELLCKVLKPGEIHAIANHISKISGFIADGEAQEAYDEAKKP